MTSQQRPHGRSRPPPALNDDSLPPHTSSRSQETMEQMIATMQVQLQDLQTQFHALTHQRPLPSLPSQPRRYSSNASMHDPSHHVPPVSRSPSPYTDTYRSHPRNPQQERSHHRFYAVQNGTAGNNVYSSREQASLYCWNYHTNWFLPGTHCVEFNDYEDAWDFLLGTGTYQSLSTPSKLMPPPPVPPLSVPPEPDAQYMHRPVSRLLLTPSMVDNDASASSICQYNEDLDNFHDANKNFVDTNVMMHTDAAAHSYNPTNIPHTIPAEATVSHFTHLHSNANDEKSTYDYKTFVHPPAHARPRTHQSTITTTFPNEVRLTPDNDSINKSLDMTTPFLTSTNHPSINNCHLNKVTTGATTQQSKHLCTLLSMTLSGHALQPFIANDIFKNKGIEMYHYLLKLRYPASAATANTILATLYSATIKANETIESFATGLCTTYKMCTDNGIPHDEKYLVQCFIRGLDDNFQSTHDHLDSGVLDWYDKPLYVVTQLMINVKPNIEVSGTWQVHKSDATAATQQGAKQPPISNSKETNPPNTTDNLAYLTQAADLHYKDVHKLMKCSFCFVCHTNRHAFHQCTLLTKNYNITFKEDNATPPTNQPSNHQSNQQQHCHPPTTQAGAARQVATLPLVLEDDAERYEGFECVQLIPQDPAPTDKKSVKLNIDNFSSKLNKHSTL